VSPGRAALVGLLSFLAGLGVALLVATGDEEPGRRVTVTAARPATGPAEEALRVREDEYRLEPARPRVRVARVIEVFARNVGTRTHALVIDTPHGELRSRRLRPGSSARMKVDLPPGRYTWYCPIADHEAKGMTGTVTVASPRRLVRRTKTVKTPTTRERTVKTVTAPPRTETKTVRSTRTVTVETSP